jgi:hypothetical protein
MVAGRNCGLRQPSGESVIVRGQISYRVKYDKVVRKKCRNLCSANSEIASWACELYENSPLRLFSCSRICIGP